VHRVHLPHAASTRNRRGEFRHSDGPRRSRSGIPPLRSQRESGVSAPSFYGKSARAPKTMTCARPARSPSPAEAAGCRFYFDADALVRRQQFSTQKNVEAAAMPH
jgi:hypothetical protein